METEKVKAIKENVGAVGGVTGAGLAALLMFIANAQDTKIDNNAENIKDVAAKIEAVQDDVHDEKLTTSQNISAIKTDVAVLSNTQTAIAATLDRIENKLDE